MGVVSEATTTAISGPVNTNTRVWVRLTEYGEQAFDRHHREMNLDPGPHRRIAEDGDGWMTFQLWDLISVFGGPYTIYLGSDVPFERNVIHFSDPHENGSTA